MYWESQGKTKLLTCINNKSVNLELKLAIVQVLRLLCVGSIDSCILKIYFSLSGRKVP